jgi:hypothetical protein
MRAYFATQTGYMLAYTLLQGLSHYRISGERSGSGYLIKWEDRLIARHDADTAAQDYANAL